MKRRTFLHAGLQTGIAAAFGPRLFAALKQDGLNEAADVLAKAVAGGQVESAVLHVVQKETTFTRAFGKANSGDAMFMLGSITKPICITALMTLFDQGEFALDDPLKKFIPQFTGDGRDSITMRQLMSHVSGLPDQLPENDTLRKNHASLAEFVDHAIRTPLNFAPGTKYQYSSMGILLATHVAELMRKVSILGFVDRTVFQPLEMKHAALGLGRFKLEDMVRVQTEGAAPESGGGNPAAKDWDWNSPYWRKLGVPWGTAHVSAPDVAKFLTEFLYRRGAVVKPATAQVMTTNQNPAGFTPRGLGLAVGSSIASPGCSEKTFGHTGSPGTIAWADPSTETICVVLTSLPARAGQPHPRQETATRVAAAAS